METAGNTVIEIVPGKHTNAVILHQESRQSAIVEIGRLLKPVSQVRILPGAHTFLQVKAYFEVGLDGPCHPCAIRASAGSAASKHSAPPPWPNSITHLADRRACRARST
jgi:hypothetical protein